MSQADWTPASAPSTPLGADAFPATELDDALGHVNDWLARNRASLSPFQEKDKARFAFRVKAFAESCLYLHIAQRLGSRISLEFASFVQDCAHSQAFRNILLFEPHSTAKYIVCLLPFAGNDAFRGVAEHYKSVCKPFNHEQLPFQTLCHVYVHHALGIADGETDRAEAAALAQSSLRRIPSGLCMPKEGPYPFTHSAFYASHFGVKPVAMGDRDRVETYIDVELAKSFALRNMDAALELVLARLCLFGRIGANGTVVLESALSLIRQKGYLLSPKTTDERLFEDDAEHEWAKSYHTMIVMGLLLMNLSERDIRAYDTKIMERLAVAMDAVGTMYTAIEDGNIALATLMLSKLDELDADVAPSPAMLAPAIAHLRSMRTLLSASAAPVLGMSAVDFAKVADLLDATLVRRATSARGFRFPEDPALCA